MNIKCIGCFELLREELTINKWPLVVYNCPRFFPYACVLSGLLRPGLGVQRAVEDCPEDPLSHCAVCQNTKITHYGQDIVSICKEHDAAWSKWLNEHPEWRVHLAPRGRSVKANWVVVFRKFVEDIRQRGKGK